MENNTGNYKPFNQSEDQYADNQVRPNLNELSASDKDFKKFVSPQRTNIAKDYLRMAEESSALKDVNLAREYLKKFSEVSGFAVKDLDKSSMWFGNTYVKNNMKYLRDVSMQYNIHTIKNYMYEAERRGLKQQAQRYADLIDLATKTSITEEASLEVSAHLDKMVSKMKYMSDPSGITQLDLARFAEIQKKYAIDKETIDKNIETSIKSYSKSMSQIPKDVAGGFLGAFTSLIDLAGNVVTLLTNKSIPSVTRHLMDAVGVDTNSWPYFLSGLTTFAFGGEFMQGLNLLKEGYGLKRSLEVFHSAPKVGIMLKKFFHVALLHMTGKATGAVASKALDNFDIEENRREVIPSIAGAIGMIGTHKLGVPSKILGAFSGESGQRTKTIQTRRGGGDAEPTGSGISPRTPRPSGTGGSGGEPVSEGDVFTPERPSQVEFNLGGKRFSLDLTRDFSVPREKSVTPVKQSAFQLVLNKSRSAVLSFYNKASDMLSKFVYGSQPEETIVQPQFAQGTPSDSDTRIDQLRQQRVQTDRSVQGMETASGEFKIETPRQLETRVIASETPSPQQNIMGESHLGAYIERSAVADGKSYIRNVNAWNIEQGAENVANYNAKIDQTGATAVLERNIEDVANVIHQQSLKKISEVEHNDADHIDSGLDITPGIDKVDIGNIDTAMSNLVDALTKEYPINEFDARKMERGSANSILRMMKDNDQGAKALGTSIMDVLAYISLGSDKNSIIVNKYMYDSIMAEKNAIFDVIGINEEDVDLSQLTDSRYTGTIAKSAIAETKSLIDARFNPEFTRFKQSIDQFARLNPERTQIALDEINDILVQLDETGRSLTKETKDLYYENVLKKISQKAMGTKFQEIPRLLRDLLSLEIPEETKGISGIYRRSMGERLMLVRRYLRSASQMYSKDTVAGFDAGVGAFGDYMSQIYTPIDRIINELMRDILEDDYDNFEAVNKEYAKYAETRAEIYKVLTDKTISGEKIWRELSKKQGLVRRLLSHAQGETLIAGSNLSKFLQLIKAELLRPILNIDTSGNVIFHVADQKQLDFGKRAGIKALLNDQQVSFLQDVSINASILADYQRYRKNNSNTENLRSIREGLSGKTLSQQIETIINSDKLMSGIRLAKNVAKISKKLKVQSLNKVVLIFNALVSIIKRLSEDISTQQTADIIARIIHVIVDPTMEALALSRSADQLMSKGYYDKV